MKILITFATEREFAPWRRRHEFRRMAAAHSVYEAEIGENTVRVVLTGMGSENARRAVRAALEEVPGIVISSGLAGALKPVHSAGDILAARQVGDVKGNRLAESSTALLAWAAECGAKIVDLFLTSEAIVASASEKRSLGRFADGVEMESEAVLSEALGRGIPVAAIRAVGDGADENLPYDFARACDERGRVRIGRVLTQIARRPHRLPALLRLARQCREASERLADFLDVYVATLAPQTNAQEMESPVAAT